MREACNKHMDEFCKTLCSPWYLWFLRPKQDLIMSLHLGKLVQMTLFWSFSGQHHIIRGIGLIFAVFMYGESAHEVLSVPIDMKCLWLENCHNKISKTVTTGMFCSCRDIRRDRVHAVIMQNTRPCCCWCLSHECLQIHHSGDSVSQIQNFKLVICWSCARIIYNAKSRPSSCINVVRQ